MRNIEVVNILVLLLRLPAVDCAFSGSRGVSTQKTRWRLESRCGTLSD